MEFLRAHGERRKAVITNEPEPLSSIDDFWTSAAQMATVGIFVLLLGAALYFCRPILLPMLAAVVIGMTLAPIVKAAARRRISPWVTALALAAVLVIAAGAALTLLAGPVSQWIAKAPEIGSRSSRSSTCSTAPWPRCASCKRS